jgi:hypothetical protein
MQAKRSETLDMVDPDEGRVLNGGGLSAGMWDIY